MKTITKASRAEEAEQRRSRDPDCRIPQRTSPLLPWVGIRLPVIFKTSLNTLTETSTRSQTLSLEVE